MKFFTCIDSQVKKKMHIFDIKVRVRGARATPWAARDCVPPSVLSHLTLSPGRHSLSGKVSRIPLFRNGDNVEMPEPWALGKESIVNTSPHPFVFQSQRVTMLLRAPRKDPSPVPHESHDTRQRAPRLPASIKPQIPFLLLETPQTAKAMPNHCSLQDTSGG